MLATRPKGSVGYIIILSGSGENIILYTIKYTYNNDRRLIYISNTNRKGPRRRGKQQYLGFAIFFYGVYTDRRSTRAHIHTDEPPPPSHCPGQKRRVRIMLLAFSTGKGLFLFFFFA